MRFIPILALWLVALCSGSYVTKEVEIHFLRQAVTALWRGLQYMEDHVNEINLDGAYGCRIVEVIFDSILESNPNVIDRLEMRHQIEHLSEKARKIAELAPSYLQIDDKGNYFADLGKLLDESLISMWHPRRVTNTSLQVQALPCSQSVFHETLSNQCLIGVLGKRGNRSSDTCKTSDICLGLMTKTGQRGYMLTHQVLYFQLAEMRKCYNVFQLLKSPRLLQDTLCTNVMRDAIEITDSGYPLDHQDLFMEQIAFCGGIWGYKDFYKIEWLEEIISWQKESGCYADRARWFCTENLRERSTRTNTRTKRVEIILRDGCLSHKTAVAVMALAANIRLIMEEISETI